MRTPGYLFLLATVFLFLLPAAPGNTQEIQWSYGNPPGFDFKEPNYKLPTEIKQAIVDNVRGIERYEGGYDKVYQEPARLKEWLLGVLEDHKKGILKVQELSNLTAFSLSETGRESLRSGTREGLKKAEESFKQAGDTVEKGLNALDRAEIIDQQVTLINAWNPEK